MGESNDPGPTARVVTAMTNPDRARCDGERLDRVSEAAAGGLDRVEHRIVVMSQDGRVDAEVVSARAGPSQPPAYRCLGHPEPERDRPVAGTCRVGRQGCADDIDGVPASGQAPVRQQHRRDPTRSAAGPSRSLPTQLAVLAAK